ncbi:hypothetical protein MGSAQ_003294 [marine sediment metagenome]|uniref:Uncharacterized protein n=1 Tax=marine sediment metagenome TaxID=412755 RepID=A0A1B6NP97_9ZZZZ
MVGHATGDVGQGFDAQRILCALIDNLSCVQIIRSST